MSNGHMFVYCIATAYRRGFGAPVKIGVSASPEARLSSLRTGCPNAIGIAGAVIVHGRDAANIVERSVHKKFEDKRLSGEWFDIGPMTALGFMADMMEHILHVAVTNGEIELSEFEPFLWMSGATAIREKMASERYLAAWESLAA